VDDCDVTDRERVRAVLRECRPDLVVNAAAYVRVDDAEDHADEAFRINAVAAGNVVKACGESGAALMHLSTDYVFDGAKAPLPYDEFDHPNPLNVYGISKYAGELAVRNYTDRHYIVRTASLYGKAGASGKGGNFVYSILDKARQGGLLRVVDDIVMSPTYALDLSQLLWEMILDRRPFGLYHAVNAGRCSWYEFAQTIVALAGLSCECVPVSCSEYPTRARRSRWSPLVSARGIRLRDWEAGLGSFLREVLSSTRR
jgi:dTDP-4-dehydrorhamnose reductase